MTARRLGEIREEFRVKKFGLGHGNPALFVRAQCFGTPVYLVWSGFSALFFFSMLMLEIYYKNNLGGKYFIFITNLGYLFQTATLLLDFVVTLHVYLKRPDVTNGKSLEMEWYLKVQWTMFNTTNTVSVLITLLYYAHLDPSFAHGSVNKHLLNGVHSFLNILFCAKPVQILHVYQPITLCVIYLIFTVFYYLAGADPIYEPLDWNKPGITSLLGLLTVFVGCPVVHVFIFYSLYTVRVYICQRCCHTHVGSEMEVSDPEVKSRDINLKGDSGSYPTHNNSIY